TRRDGSQPRGQAGRPVHEAGRSPSVCRTRGVRLLPKPPLPVKYRSARGVSGAATRMRTGGARRLAGKPLALGWGAGRVGVPGKGRFSASTAYRAPWRRRSVGAFPPGGVGSRLVAGAIAVAISGGNYPVTWPEAVAERPPAKDGLFRCPFRAAVRR